MAAFWTRFSGYPSQVNQEAVQHVTYSPQSNCTADQYRNISNALIRLWKNGTLEAPKANRLSFHSAATFTAASGPGAVGGPNGGWFQFPENMNFPENSALQDTISILLNLTREHTCITFADIVFFAGAVLTEAAGGPPIAWMPGRLDAIRKTPSPSTAAIKQSTPPLAARLPDASFTIAGVLYFYTQMGFSVREMVAINGGGHSFGGADPTGSGWNGSFTQADDAWPSPKNAFFIQTFNVTWEPQVLFRPSDNGPRIQYVLRPGQGVEAFTEDGSHIIRLPSDVALLTAGGNTTAWALSYAQDENLFLNDFARVYQRTSQLGAGTSWEPSSDYAWLGMYGNATNYGKYISVQEGDNPPVQASMSPPTAVFSVVKAPPSTMP